MKVRSRGACKPGWELASLTGGEVCPGPGPACPTRTPLEIKNSCTVGLSQVQSQARPLASTQPRPRFLPLSDADVIVPSQGALGCSLRPIMCEQR